MEKNNSQKYLIAAIVSGLLFLLDLVVIDPIPFIDEGVLGILLLIFAKKAMKVGKDILQEEFVSNDNSSQNTQSENS